MGTLPCVYYYSIGSNYIYFIIYLSLQAVPIMKLYLVLFFSLLSLNGQYKNDKSLFDELPYQYYKNVILYPIDDLQVQAMLEEVIFYGISETKLFSSIQKNYFFLRFLPVR